jgi:hypothetical protein
MVEFHQRGLLTPTALQQQCPMDDRRRPATVFPAWLALVALFPFHVASAAGETPKEALEWHVAVQGNDNQPGAPTRPFATVQRALADLARLRSAGDERPAAIVLHEGTYEIVRPLEIGPAHASSSSLTLRAAENARPVISGGRRLKGWTRSDDGSLSLKAAGLPASIATFRELFVNDERRPRARHPNTGYVRIAEPFPDKRSGFTFNAGDFHAAVGGGAELVFLHDWSISRIAVKSIDHQTRRLTTSDPIGVAGDYFSVDFFEPHPRYFLENHAALLDAPGEWYFHHASGTLSYRPLPGEAADALEAVVPVSPAILRVRGTEAGRVRNVHVLGITFAHASWPLPAGGYAGLQATTYENRAGDRDTAPESYPPGSPERDTGRAMAMLPAAVAFELADDCSVVDCRIAHVGTSGMAFGSQTRRCRLEGCLIEDISGNGVNLGEGTSRLVDGRTWWEAVPEQAASQHAVVNNLIRQGGQQFFGAVGIWVGIAHDVRIAHNEIRDLPYTGVSLGWMWSPASTPAGKNVVEYNHIHHVMQTLSDGGGIYTLGRQSGSSLAHNHIHDVPVNVGRAESNGMFLDEGTDGFEIAGNLIHGISRSPLRFHQARDNVVRENVLVIPDPGTPEIRYNSTDPKTIRQSGNAIVKQQEFERARYRGIIDAAGPEPAYRDRWKPK